MEGRPAAATVINVIASGNLGREVDLQELQRDIESIQKEYNPESHPGLQLRFEENGPLLTLYSSGSYVIMGAESREKVQLVYEQFVESLDRLDMGMDSSTPTVQNIICKANLNREVDLKTLIAAFGLENIEYEPEQSPFLYYWPEEFDCVVSIPTNGQIVITGVRNLSEAESVFNLVKEKVEF